MRAAAARILLIGLGTPRVRGVSAPPPLAGAGSSCCCRYGRHRRQDTLQVRVRHDFAVIVLVEDGVAVGSAVILQHGARVAARLRWAEFGNGTSDQTVALSTIGRVCAIALLCAAGDFLRTSPLLRGRTRRLLCSSVRWALPRLLLPLPVLLQLLKTLDGRHQLPLLA